MAFVPQALRAARRFGKTAQRYRRRLLTLVTRPDALLIYHSDYSNTRDSLTDSRRAQKIIDYLLKEGHLSSRHVVRPGYIPIDELSLIHDPEYLRSLDEPEVLERIFGEHKARVNTDSLIKQQRRMVAGTMLAAKMAVDDADNPRPIFNLGGGMHHANREHGGGFCIFNDVAIAIARLRANGYDGRILVLDLDLHQGDGTRRIFADDETVFTCSIHATDWDDRPAIADLNVPLGGGVGDHVYLDALDTTLPKAFSEAKPDLVFYVAGVDIANDDQLGSWRVTPWGVFERDRTVLRYIDNLPSVWVMAGGYGPSAWRYTARTLAWMLGEDGRIIPTEQEQALRHFRRISHQFEPGELTAEPTADSGIHFSLDDILGDLAPTRSGTKLLGFYSRYGVECALERYGILNHLRSLGYHATQVEFDLNRDSGQLTRLYTDDGHRDLLIELVLSESYSANPYRLLCIEWLMLQNPRIQPSPERPLLPGQQHPGLGCLRGIVMMLVMTCERLGFDGLLFTPAHFHVATVARGLLSFLDPAVEARFLAFEEALAGVPLIEATRMVHNGEIIDTVTGETVSWSTAPMVMPVSKTLELNVASAEYQTAVRQAATNIRFAVRPNVEDSNNH